MSMKNIYQCLTPAQSLQLAKDVQEWYIQVGEAGRLVDAERTAENINALKIATDKCSELFDKWRYITPIFNVLTVIAVNEHCGRISK